MNKNYTQLPEVHLPEARTNWFARHYLWGYAFLILSFLLAITLIYQLEYKKPEDVQICIQVVTQARNIKTGEFREFPTPCDVPDGWQAVTSNSEPNSLQNSNISF